MADQSLTRAVRRARGAVVLLGALMVSPPALAQDFFGFFRFFSPPVYRQPIYSPYRYRSVPRLDRRVFRHRPKIVRARAEPPASKIGLVPKAPGEDTNPLPQLLTDSTLRRGDIVMFPEGPRVFLGRPSTNHSLAEFVPASQAGRAVSPSTRKLLASMRPDRSSISAEKMMASSLMAKVKDVETTGTVKRRRR